MNEKNFKEQSKILWSPVDRQPSTEELSFGCLQRIADASESMAKNHQQLVADKEAYERWYKNEREKNQKFAHRIAGLRGVITKMKKANQK